MKGIHYYLLLVSLLFVMSCQKMKFERYQDQIVGDWVQKTDAWDAFNSVTGLPMTGAPCVSFLDNDTFQVFSNGCNKNTLIGKGTYTITEDTLITYRMVSYKSNDTIYYNPPEVSKGMIIRLGSNSMVTRNVKTNGSLGTKVTSNKCAQ